MRSFTALIFSGLFVAANAHFQLQFPPPRGNFVEDSEPTFCDGYDTVASNRTSFPLTGGIISFNSEHPQWTATVLFSNTSNPTSFDNFTQVTPFFQESIEGSYCMHFDLSSTNATGLQNGNNVTIQILFNGGDGNLYQCADLTLDTSADVSSQSCTNSSSTSSSNSSSSSGSSSSSSAALELSVPVAGALLGLAGLAIALL